MIKPSQGGLATLLEGAGSTSTILECDFQTFYLLWCFTTVKLDFYGRNGQLSASTIDGDQKRCQLTCNCRDISVLTLKKYFDNRLRAYLGLKKCKHLEKLFKKLKCDKNLKYDYDQRGSEQVARSLCIWWQLRRSLREWWRRRWQNGRLFLSV